MTSTVGDVAGPVCNAGDGTGIDTETNAETGAGVRGDVDGPERVEGKLDITTSSKTNKTPILMSYQLNVQLFV